MTAPARRRWRAAGLGAVAVCAGLGAYGAARQWHAGLWLASDAEMREWFQWGTGLDLPPETEHLAGRECGAYLGEFYLKSRVPTGFAATLEAEFARLPAAEVPEAPAVPEALGPDLAFWDVAAMGSPAFYQKEVGTAEEGGFVTTLALDLGTGLAYCAIHEFAP